MMKMAQFEPSISRWGILDRSCSMALDEVDVNIGLGHSAILYS
jgi:hypothetical protein